MSRYVDAEYIKAVMLNDRLMQGNAEFTLYAQQVETQVNALPSIEITRCGECKWFDSGKNDSEIWSMCTRHFGKYIDVNADDFCSYGEREGE